MLARSLARNASKRLIRKRLPPGCGSGSSRGGAALWLAFVALGVGAVGCRPAITEATEPEPALVATGRCLGRLCIGMTESAALAAMGAPTPAGSDGGARCFHIEDADLDLSFEVDGADASRPIRSILVSSPPRCPGGEAVRIDSAGRIADCRGLRPGDPESFATKVHRQAAPIPGDADPWPAAPEGVRGLEDLCEPAAADAARAGFYLRDGRVVGLAVWKP